MPDSTTGSSPRNFSRYLSRTAVRRSSASGTSFTSSLQIGQARISSSSLSIAISRELYTSPAVRILHLAAGNRWTGAAAPAFAEVEALRAAGIDAHYAYAGGYKLEKKIGHLDFTHPLIEKSQNPAAFARTIRALADLGKFDFVHAHLTYDHWLARFVARRTGASIARTFHSRRVLRNDPFTQSLIRSTRALFVVNDTFRVRGRDAV